MVVSRTECLLNLGKHPSNGFQLCIHLLFEIAKAEDPAIVNSEVSLMRILEYITLPPCLQKERFVLMCLLLFQVLTGFCQHTNNVCREQHTFLA